MVPSARSTTPGLVSTSWTSMFAVANTWAMPFPMVPAPTTATLRSAAAGPPGGAG